VLTAGATASVGPCAWVRANSPRAAASAVRAENRFADRAVTQPRPGSGLSFAAAGAACAPAATIAWFAVSVVEV
jgi:hypothetical protein